jgi:hypothetical protein
MKTTFTLLASLVLAPRAALCAIDPQGRKAGTPCEAANGFESFRLGGFFGRRVETLIRGNVVHLDMEKDFVGLSRNNHWRLAASAAQANVRRKRISNSTNLQPCNTPFYLS